MKKVLVLALTAMLLCAAALPALAEDAALFTAKGTVWTDTVMLLAPMSGQVENFSLSAGDSLLAGQTAFTLRPMALFAPASGIVRSLRALPGDQAQAVSAQYGALLYIEKDAVWQVAASMQGGYNAIENRDIQVGDMLRGQTISRGDKINGTASVFLTGNREFTVEMERGDFELEDTVKFYIGSGKEHASKDYIGSGKVSRPAPLPVMGEGTVAKVLVKEGDRVERGQPLVYLDSAGMVFQNNDVLPEVRAEADCMIAQVLVTPGQMVSKGQAVLAVYPSGALEAQLSVDELDIAKVKTGQTIAVTVDAYKDQVFTATVNKINPLGVTVMDTTKFIVTISFQDAQGLMPGMHVKGLWAQ